MELIKTTYYYQLRIGGHVMRLFEKDVRQLARLTAEAVGLNTGEGFEEPQQESIDEAVLTSWPMLRSMGVGQSIELDLRRVNYNSLRGRLTYYKRTRGVEFTTETRKLFNTIIIKRVR